MSIDPSAVAATLLAALESFSAEDIGPAAVGAAMDASFSALVALKRLPKEARVAAAYAVWQGGGVARAQALMMPGVPGPCRSRPAARRFGRRRSPTRCRARWWACC